MANNVRQNHVPPGVTRVQWGKKAPSVSKILIPNNAWNSSTRGKRIPLLVLLYILWRRRCKILLSNHPLNVMCCACEGLPWPTSFCPPSPLLPVFRHGRGLKRFSRGVCFKTAVDSSTELERSQV